MSTHEITNHQQQIEPGSDRSFGLIVGGIVGLIGGYQYWVGSNLAVWLLSPAAFLIVAALLAPKVLHPLNVLWTKFGLLLGRVVAPIVMFIVYVSTMIPIALLLRLFRKDLLRLKKNQSGSYWIMRDPPGPAPESLEDQF